MSLYLEWTRSETPAPRDQLLEEHPDLRDVLEPLLADGAVECEDAPIPISLPSLRLVRELGRGGAGIVYEAVQESLGRRVAVKVLWPERRLDPRSLARFSREARAGSLLEHPHLVRVLDYGESEGVHYLVQELVGDGRTLEHEIWDMRRLGEPDKAYFRRVAERVLEVAEGLHAAHEAGVIHRDIKPGNILIDAEGRARLADFGLARFDSSLTVSNTRALLGTPSYMSPEQVSGEEVGRASDQFSLAATLYEALCLERPFAAASTPQLIAEIQLAEPPDPRSRLAGVPGDLAAIALRGLERTPSARYPTARSMAEDLRLYLDGGAIVARPPGMLRPLRRWILRRPALAVGLGSLVALTLTALVAFVSVSTSKRKLLQLSDGVSVRDVVGREAGLWPVEPALIERAAEWLADARTTAERTTRYIGRREEVASQATNLGANVAPSFADLETRWIYESLDEITSLRERLVSPGAGLIASVERRVALVESVADRTLDSLDAHEAWARARSEIKAHPLYSGLDLPPQYGLLPLGPNEPSGLWEFGHVLTGESPASRVRPGREAGIVFILLPGGETLVGSQDSDPEEPNYEPSRCTGPVFAVELEPYFLAKHELTQAQWRRMMGTNPAHHRDDHPGGPRPVEQVSWDEATLALFRHGLRLPAEAEWENAARAGTNHPYGYAAGIPLERCANLKDIRGASGSPWGSVKNDPVDDGASYPAPVGSYLPNGWGFHDMIGNVGEWCEDEFAPYPTPSGKKRVWEVGVDFSGHRVIRGSGFHRPSQDATVSHRDKELHSFTFRGTGVRPARSLDF